MVLEVEDDRLVLKDLNNNRLLPSSLLWDYQDFRQTKHFQIEKLNYVCDLENLLCILSLLLLLLLLQSLGKHKELHQRRFGENCCSSFSSTN